MLMSRMRAAMQKYRMVAPGDRIAVRITSALPGGDLEAELT